MAKEFKIEDLPKQELASLLRKPQGEKGQKVAKQMNKGNKHICLNSYEVLNPNANTLVVEIGMGNGLFVKELIHSKENLSYVGVDFSETMVKEAISLNKNLMEKHEVSFVNGSIEALPFKDNSVDYITTTNTIYFWPDLIENIKEVYRVLKPGGKILIAYRSKDLMDKIEVANYNFNKYTSQEIEALLSTVEFTSIETKKIAEPELDFDGKKMEMGGFYSTAIK